MHRERSTNSHWGLSRDLTSYLDLLSYLDTEEPSLHLRPTEDLLKNKRGFLSFCLGCVCPKMQEGVCGKGSAEGVELLRY